jgi:Ca2+-binding RTX toxin-like protein
MRALSVRHVLVTAASLLLVGGINAPTRADPGPRADDDAFAATAITQVRASSADASVDPRVSRAIARAGAVEAILILDDEAPLARASASVDDDSRELLRRIVPAYDRLKSDVRSRIPQLQVLGDYRTLPILHVRVRSRAVLERAAADPSVVGIAANGEYRPLLTQSLALVNQPAAIAAGHTGAGTAVAVIDSGVDHTRSAFGDCSGGAGTGTCKVVVSQDFAPNDGRLDDPILHGTNVAGIVVGVAPDTSILALDVFGTQGASDVDILDAIDFTISNQAAFNVRAMNLSLGDVSFNTSQCGQATNPFVSAFSNARAAGIVPVVASGNSRFDNGADRVGVASPACTPGAVSVGAVYDSNVGGVAFGSGNDRCSHNSTSADKITCFSQVANYLSVLAPGVFIDAAGVRQQGTSQAAPHVAGAVAAIADASPASSPTTIENALRNSGPLINDPLVNRQFHRLDVPAAIAALGTEPPPPPPGTCTIEGNNKSNFLQGTPGDDVICGKGGDDVLVPSGGTDTVVGGNGFDFVSFEDASAGAEVDLAARTATAGSNLVTLERIEGAIGSPFADHLMGNRGPNDLVGLGGRDLVDGAGGFDFVRFDLATGPIRASIASGVARGEGNDRLLRVEGIIGGPASDELEGSAARDVLVGLSGNDVLSGLARADTLFGDAGSDELFGGLGGDDLFGGTGADACEQQGGSGTISSC